MSDPVAAKVDVLKEGRREVLRWIPVGLAPLANGVLRMTTYQHAIGEQAAGWVSSGLDVAAIVAWATFLAPPADRRLRAGVWLVSTTVFHFVLGQAFGMTVWDSVRKYDIAAGEPWLLVSAVVGASPWLAAALRRR